jgi:hypothetical protein
MYKIEKLTDEMLMRIPKIRDEWIQKILSCKPIDRDKATTLLNSIYADIKLPKPTIFFLPNPKYLLIAPHLASRDIVTNLTTSEQLTDMIDESQDNNKYTGVEADNLLFSWGYIHWIAYLDFFGDYIEESKTIYEKFKLIDHIKIINPFENVCFVSENPKFIHRDTSNRLHCTNGPAIAFDKGFELYRWKGVRFPKEALLPGWLTREKILSEKNVELRRIYTEIIGCENLISFFKFKMVNQDHVGKLWKGELPTGEQICMVELCDSTPEIDGTRKRYFEFVPFDIETSHQAVAWQFNITPDQYNPLIES